MAFEDELRRARIVPVIVIRDVAQAVPLARALVAGGLNILEITLRTPDALDAINGDPLNKAADAGARFIVSPGLTEDVANTARTRGVPLLAGVVSASDIMRGLALGLSSFKFFPAETSGGAPAIKALGGPFPQVRFCPTGGVSPKNLSSYLVLPNVICAGGSWMVPPDLSEEGAYDRATEMARQARALAQGLTA
jgi:2-dehydro-3-deoxyphosphogluconate aldolase/(4S)-4-hydroxy-2-oxoglutarate aldolase